MLVAVPALAGVTTAAPGTQTITVTNDSGLAGEINLDNAGGSARLTTASATWAWR